MDEAAIRKKLHQLNESVRTSPLFSAALKDSAGVYEPTGGDEEPTVGESLDRLRLQLKYVLFDLEATRRENRYLRQMLDSRNKRDSEDGRRDNW